MAGLDHRSFLAQTFALINPMQVSRSEWAGLEAHRLMPKGLERHERMMPRLLELRALSRDERLQLLQRAERWDRDRDLPFFSALLQSDASLPRLRSHLLGSMFPRHPEKGKVWLRMHDPRVFRHLRWVLDHGQLAQLMGPVARWTWFDPLSRSWHGCDRPEAEPGIFEPTRRQWEQIEAFEALNRCLRDIADETGRPPSDADAKPLLEALIEAVALDLRDMADRCLYARQRMAHGEDFRLQPSTRRRLAKVAEEGISYVAACLVESSEGPLRAA